MKQFHVPSEYIERLAIEQAARSNAWLVIPKCIGHELIESLVYQLGFGDCVDVATWDKVPDEVAVVMLYPDLIFEEFMEIVGLTEYRKFFPCQLSASMLSKSFNCQSICYQAGPFVDG